MDYRGRLEWDNHRLVLASLEGASHAPSLTLHAVCTASGEP
jgi:hypothetical protein